MKSVRPSGVKYTKMKLQNAKKIVEINKLNYCF